MILQSPINAKTAVQYAASLPSHADVVIIGAGIAGMATALPLVEAGKRVVVCEKGRVGGEQSSRNWGWVRQTGRDPDEYPIMVDSLRLWNGMAARTGENCLNFQEQGVLYVSEDESAEEAYARSLQIAKEHGVDSFLLNRDEIKQRVPSAKKSWCIGLTTPTDGRVEPWSAVPAMARAVVRAGGSILENCAVNAIDTRNTAVSGVHTERGYIQSDQVLLAGGAWSSLLAQQSGVNLPQLSVQATVARYESDTNLFDGNIKDNALALCKRSDGGYNVALTDHQKHFIGPDSFRHLKLFFPALRSSIKQTRYGLAPVNYPDAWGSAVRSKDTVRLENNRVLDPVVDTKLVNRMTQRLKARFQHDESLKVTHAWSGMIDTMPDFVPVLDECADVSGLFIATGFSGHGFGIGPGVGQIMSDLLQAKASHHNLTRFRLSRFTDATPLVLGPL